MLQLCPSILLTFSAAVLATTVSGLALSPSDFLIESLPGLEAELNFSQYAGYMPINDGSDTEIFFWFVESQKDPTNDPLALWMNGGPGSSSIAYGFWTEHGPFRLADSGNGTYVPELYEYSWNTIANVLYIEAPAGVGFSRSNNPQKYRNITDAQSSYDNFLFLKAWFEVFADFKSNAFFITAESYGGHYGPTLAEQLLDNENDINMKGFLIGNPGINSDWYYNVNEYAFLTFMNGHGLIPAAAYNKARNACDWDNFFSNCTEDFTHPSPECFAATQLALKYIPSPLDPYDVLVPTCHENNDPGTGANVGARFVEEYTPHLNILAKKYGLDIEYNPCISNWTPQYLNRKDVMKALHIDGSYKRHWPNHPIGWSYNEGPEGAKKDIAKLFPKFFEKAPHWKIVVVSGTADSAVPFIGTERWMECLQRPVTNDWRAWKLHGDVAGMIKEWDHMSFVTVAHCGHMIPLYCPEAGLAFFENWLHDSW